MAHSPALTYDASIDKRKEYATMRSAMLLERASYEAHYTELANFVKPRRVRLFKSERNRGDKRNQKIFDPTASYCLEVLRNGMHTNLTSPASPWLAVGLSDPDLMKYKPVKVWLDDITDRALAMFQKSNLYNVLPTVYGDEALFATAAMGSFEDSEDMCRSFSYPMGSYACGLDSRGKVNTFMREWQMSTRQIVKDFGVISGSRDIDWSNISQSVHDEWDKGHYDSWHDVCWMVTPNDEYDPRRYNSKYKKFASCWFEFGAEASGANGGNEAKFLRESGFNEFPVFVPRWEATGEDTYGTECPGMNALADIKMLQTGEKRSLQAVEKMVNPPMQAPTHLRSSGVSVIPGGVTYTDVSVPNGAVRSLYEVNFQVDKLEMKQEGVRQRLYRHFSTNLFLMLASGNDTQKTAREIAERHEEKLLSLGAIVNRNDDELLTPMVFRHLAIAGRAGRLPPPPPEVRNSQFQLNYTSVMHEAQKLVKVGSEERFMANMVQLVEIFPEARYKLKIFATIDSYADKLSIDPSTLNTDEEAQALLDQANQAQAAQQAAATAKDGASAAKTLSETNVTADNGLTRIMNNQQPRL